eukprot:3995643-Amphidinium_carterae.1
MCHTKLTPRPLTGNHRIGFTTFFVFGGHWCHTFVGRYYLMAALAGNAWYCLRVRPLASGIPFRSFPASEKESPDTF